MAAAPPSGTPNSAVACYVVLCCDQVTCSEAPPWQLHRRCIASGAHIHQIIQVEHFKNCCENSVLSCKLTSTHEVEIRSTVDVTLQHSL